MTILTENETSFFLSTPATLINDQLETASNWAAEHVVPNKAHKWVLARYVEADNPNGNRQFWSLNDLQANHLTVKNSPMNIGHRAHNIVGSWTAADLLYPTEEQAGNPYVETLGVFWKAYFPEMLAQVEAAFETGALSVSMECVGSSVTCAGPDGCGETFDFLGPMDESYCEHLLSYTSFKQINDPHFLAGALILPPDRPGWSDARVKELSQSDEHMQRLYEDVQVSYNHLDYKQIESLMFSILEHTNAQNVEKKMPASIIGLQVANNFMAKAYQ